MGIRDRLRNRPRPQATVRLRIDATSEFVQMESDLARVNAELSYARTQETRDQLRIDSLTEQRSRLTAELEPGYEILTLTALPPSEFEALMSEHPPTEKQREDGANWNRDTFFPSLLAACVQGEETEEDWQEIVTNGELVLGEFQTLVSVALDLNDRSPDVMLGKGLTPTSS